MDHVIPHIRVRNTLVDAGICVLLVVSLPLLGLLAFGLRPLVLIVAIASLAVCALLWTISGTFRDWIVARTTPLIDYRGFRLAPEVVLHPGHGWARAGQEVAVGADDIVEASLGPVDQVYLPVEGMHIRRGDPLFRLAHAGRIVDVRCPVSGTIVRINTALRSQPELINRSPFQQGWVAELRPDDFTTDRRHLLSGRYARAWFREEVDHLLETLPQAGPGGEQELHQRIDDSAWATLKGMFT